MEETVTDLTPALAKFGLSLMDRINNPKVEVRDAGVKGRGVFAKQDIKIGDPLAFYDGEDKKIDKKSSKILEKYYMISLPDIAGRKGWARYGYIEPQSKIGIGQLVNDSQMIDFEINKPVENFREEFKIIKRKIKKYEKSQRKRVNIILHMNQWFYALKDIKKDDELLWSYGASYWVVQAFDKTKIKKRRVLLMKIMKLRNESIIFK